MKSEASQASNGTHVPGMFVDRVHKNTGVFRVVVREHSMTEVGDVVMGAKPGQHVLDFPTKSIRGSVEGTRVEITL